MDKESVSSESSSSGSSDSESSPGGEAKAASGPQEEPPPAPEPVVPSQAPQAQPAESQAAEALDEAVAGAEAVAGGGAGAAAAAAAAGPGDWRNVKLTIPHFGTIEYKGCGTHGSFRVECCCDGHNDCFRERTKTWSVAGMGRPLGYLTAWLMADGCNNRTQHMKKMAKDFSLETRVESREFLKTLGPTAQALLDCEDQGVGQEEPKKVAR